MTSFVIQTPSKGFVQVSANQPMAWQRVCRGVCPVALTQLNEVSFMCQVTDGRSLIMSHRFWLNVTLMKASCTRIFRCLTLCKMEKRLCAPVVQESCKFIRHTALIFLHAFTSERIRIGTCYGCSLPIFCSRPSKDNRAKQDKPAFFPGLHV